MIVCPNCNHQNPEGSTQCENCYTPLPQTTSCPNCGASVQTDATFCGQCGFNLQIEMIEPVMEMSENSEEYQELSHTYDTESTEYVPPAVMESALQSPWDEEEKPVTLSEEINPWERKETEVMRPEQSPFAVDSPWDNQESSEESEDLEQSLEESEDLLDLVNAMENSTASNSVETEEEAEPFSAVPPLWEEPKVSGNQEENLSFSPPPAEPQVVVPKPEMPSPVSSSFNSATQLQVQTAKLLHVQTNTILEIPPNLDVVHIGKPNSQIPPDIDASGFANSDIVSRIHADIRIEGDAYFIEDVGSSNGTYINHNPLLVGNRHRLRSGDRIALGKGDLVTFIFQISD